MHSIASILLRCILALALVMGGLPVWGASATPSQYDATLAQVASDGDNADCHSDMAEHQPDADYEESAHDCCEKDAGCEHETCRCLCPATSLVVPVRLGTTLPAAKSHPPSPLNAPAPHDIISSLLRPPRA
ncbi:CopL family metal-binding regulatory protein [Wenzhouxiangella sp. XN201]|nr:CopL family metal-binding regulatory protein [Wenzhouxiangella sp. XN201]